MTSRSLRRFLRLRALAGDQRGIAAVEFALMLPFMLIVFAGVAEVGQAVAISRKVTITTRGVTDLTTQYTSVSSSDLATIIGAGNELIAPYSAANLTITISEVQTDANSNATIAWSSSSSLPAGTKVTLPSGLSAPNIYLIWGQVQYNYVPLMGSQVIGTTTLQDQIYMSPRLTNSIAYTG